MKKTHSERDVRELLSLVRDAYRPIGALYKSYRVYKTQEAVFRKAQELFREIDGDGRWECLASYLDSHLDRVVSDLVATPLKLDDKDIRLFCCLALGFDAQLISELTGVCVNTVYSRKFRLVRKISRLGVVRSRRFLDLLE